MKTLREKLRRRYENLKKETKKKIRRIEEKSVKTYAWIKTSIVYSDTVNWFLELNLTPIMIFFASYALTIQYEVWERIIFSIGIYQVTEYLIQRYVETKMKTGNKR